jgi:hypothetical protein
LLHHFFVQDHGRKDPFHRLERTDNISHGFMAECVGLAAFETYLAGIPFREVMESVESLMRGNGDQFGMSQAHRILFLGHHETGGGKLIVQLHKIDIRRAPYVEIFTEPVNVDGKNGQRGEDFQLPVQRAVTIESVLNDTLVPKQLRDSLPTYRETRGHPGANLGGAHVDSLIAIHEALIVRLQRIDE